MQKKNHIHNSDNNIATYRPKYILLSHIRIDKFKDVIPDIDDLKKEYDIFKQQYRLNNNNLPDKLPEPIIIDKHKNLIEGYITYLIYRMFGYKKVNVMMIIN